MLVQHARAAEQARANTCPRKINVTSKSPVGDISVVTLIRTDTTLDHSQKAEKVCLTPKNFLVFVFIVNKRTCFCDVQCHLLQNVAFWLWRSVEIHLYQRLRVDYFDSHQRMLASKNAAQLFSIRFLFSDPKCRDGQHSLSTFGASMVSNLVQSPPSSVGRAQGP